MTAPALRIALPLFALLLSAACDRTPPAAEPLPALERPLTAAALRNDRVLVPQATVVERGGQPGVFVVTDGVARFRMVRTGKTYEGRVEILSGLAGGEPLVASDLREVRDGSPVKATSATDERR